MKRFYIVLIILSFLSLKGYCYTVDESIDSGIRQKYNTKAIETDLLPKLPEISPSGESENIYNTVKTENYNKTYKEVKIKKGTIFKIRSYRTIADTTPKGTQVKFVAVYPETSRYITIPKGTIFVGEITNSHSPQFFGNGGLIELKVDTIIYQGTQYQINSKVSIANYKRIFLNNIKGKRAYAAQMKKLMHPSRQFMGRMCKTSRTLTDGPEILLSPLPIIGGIVVYAANACVSPILAIFATGHPITLQNGTYFEIKLTEDTLLKVAN